MFRYIPAALLHRYHLCVHREKSGHGLRKRIWVWQPSARGPKDRRSQQP